MIRAEAERIVGAVLVPETVGRFFGGIVGRRPATLVGGDNAHRRGLFGTDPRATLLDAHAVLAPTLTCHAHAPAGPPPVPGPVADASGFAELVGLYHARGYTVRVPEVTALSPGLAQFIRALSLLVGKPAEAAVFWSAAGGAAPVHYDEHDILVIQLLGAKKWFVSGEQPGLNNVWRRVGEAQPALGRHKVFDMAPGDLAYLPRGTPHTVQSTSESIHLSIGFVPVTVRDAMIALVDHLSDAERPLRETLGAPDVLGGAMERLLAATRDPDFVAEALDRRTARAVAALPRLARAETPPAIAIDTPVRHASLAIAHVAVADATVDVTLPHAQILVHRGAEAAVRFIVDTPAFAPRDLPGELGEDVRLALVARFVANGFLEPA